MSDEETAVAFALLLLLLRVRKGGGGGGDYQGRGAVKFSTTKKNAARPAWHKGRGTPKRSICMQEDKAQEQGKLRRQNF